MASHREITDAPIAPVAAVLGAVFAVAGLFYLPLGITAAVLGVGVVYTDMHAPVRGWLAGAAAALAGVIETAALVYLSVAHWPVNVLP